jgi:hypothetical protein
MMDVMPRTLPALLLASLLAACAAPPGAVGPTLTLGGLGEGQPAQVVTMASGQRDLTLALSPNRPALLALAFPSNRVGTLIVDARLEGQPAAGLPPLGFGLTAREDEAIPFELQLRRHEARLPRRPRHPGYRLQAAADAQLEDRERFWVIARSDEQGNLTDRQIETRVAYVGSHCVVVTDTRLDTRLDDRAKELGTTFDSSIYATDTRIFGEPTGPAAGRTTLLISPEVGDRGRDTTIGYFTVRDLLAREQPGGDAGLDMAHSNQRPILYLSSNVVGRGRTADYLGTVAHEFEHLLNASHKLAASTSQLIQEDTWLDEGLAMYAMQANGYGLGSDASVLFDHVAGYLRAPATYSLTNWELNPQESGYGVSYLFLTYVADRFGEQVLGELARASDTGMGNVEARLKAHDAQPDQVFQDWVGATLIDGTGMSSEPRYDYASIDLMGSYGRRRLRGVTVMPLLAPKSGRLNLLPYSANYLLVHGSQEASYTVSLTGASVQTLVLTPR